MQGSEMRLQKCGPQSQGIDCIYKIELANTAGVFTGLGLQLTDGMGEHGCAALHLL